MKMCLDVVFRKSCNCTFFHELFIIYEKGYREVFMKRE